MKLFFSVPIVAETAALRMFDALLAAQTSGQREEILVEGMMRVMHVLRPQLLSSKDWSKAVSVLTGSMSIRGRPCPVAVDDLCAPLRATSPTTEVTVSAA